MDIDSEPVGLNKPKIFDAQGNEIKPPKCKCGQECDTIIMGITYHQWTCNKCLYGDMKSGSLIYRAPEEFTKSRFNDKFKEKYKIELDCLKCREDD